MLLTYTGAIIGGIAFYNLAKWTGTRNFNGYELLMPALFGMLIGGGIGFGYGSSLLINGTHPYNKLISMIKG